MNDKLDVFEILGKNNNESQKQDQGQKSVSDPDFNEAIKQLSSRYSDIDPAHKEKAMTSAARPAQNMSPAPKKTVYQTAQKHPVKPAAPNPNVVNTPTQMYAAPAAHGTAEKKKHFHRKKNKSGSSEIPQNKKWRLVKILLSIAVILLFFTFVINVPKVVGSSMEPELGNGDRVVINLLARNYEVGDIIVFKTAGGEKLVKRIVAVDGDVVNITPDRKFFLNGQEAEEEYIFTETGITDIAITYPVIVNEDTYFVMGDNRTNSKDSRNSDVGLVEKDDIIGKVVFCLRKY